MRRLTLAFVCCLLSCETPDKGPGTGTPPESFCPGAEGCKKGPDQIFKVGIGSTTFTPTGMEKVKPEALSTSGADHCNELAVTDALGVAHCGKLKEGVVTSCGNDRLCTGDFFEDCGRDQRCPGSPGYAGPDEDGSEGDGKFQGFWVAGYSSNTPMINVHDELTARCVAMVNGDVSIGLCSVDAVGLFRDDVEKIRAATAKKLEGGSLSYDYLVISATHTHHGVDTEGQWGPKTGPVPTTRGVDDAWLNNVLFERTAQAAADALTSVRPAKVFATQAKLGMAINDVLSDHRDPYVADDTLTVMKFVEAKGGVVIGSLVSWGEHPETLADTNNTVSADYPWALREGLEKGVFKKDGSMVRSGLGGTAVFMEGSVGGMMTTLGVQTKDQDGVVAPQHSFQKIKAIGDVLAIAALDALAAAPELPSPPLAFGSQKVLVKVENEIFHLAFQGNLFRRRSYEYDDTKGVSATNMPKIMSEVGKVQVGNLRFLTVPGELLPELAVGYDERFAFGHPQISPTNELPPDLSAAPKGPYLKEQLGGDMPCVLGLANDHVGYLVPPYNYLLHPTKPYLEEAAGHHYEETNSIGPSVVPTLLEAYGALLSWEPAP